MIETVLKSVYWKIVDGGLSGAGGVGFLTVMPQRRLTQLGIDPFCTVTTYQSIVLLSAAIRLIDCPQFAQTRGDFGNDLSLSSNVTSGMVDVSSLYRYMKLQALIAARNQTPSTVVEYNYQKHFHAMCAG